MAFLVAYPTPEEQISSAADAHVEEVCCADDGALTNKEAVQLYVLTLRLWVCGYVFTRLSNSCSWQGPRGHQLAEQLCSCVFREN
jgi:hypothetical protein